MRGDAKIEIKIPRRPQGFATNISSCDVTVFIHITMYSVRRGFTCRIRSDCHIPPTKFCPRPATDFSCRPSNSTPLLLQPFVETRIGKPDKNISDGEVKGGLDGVMYDLIVNA